MSLSLPFSRDIFNGAAAFYDGQLAPLMVQAEHRRRIALRDAGAIGAVTFLAAVAGLRIGGDAGMIVAMFAGMIGFGAAGARINRTRGEITNDLVGPLAEHLGFDYMRTRNRPDYCEPFRRFGLLRRFNRETWEDEIVGGHEGVAFSLVEAHLKYRTNGRKKKTRTVFHGQLIVIEIPQRFAGTTIIKRDAKILNALASPGREYQKVGLASSKFERIFEAWSTDQVEARMLLEPIMLERFEELDRLFDGAQFRAAFSNGKLYIALNVGDRLNMGTMFKPIDGHDRMRQLLQEFDLVFDLIDVATRRAPSRLDGPLSVDDVRAG